MEDSGESGPGRVMGKCKGRSELGISEMQKGGVQREVGDEAKTVHLGCRPRKGAVHCEQTSAKDVHTCGRGRGVNE